MPPINPMKILNLAPFAHRRSASLNLIQRLQGALRYGLSWFWNYPAQERLAELLQEHLDRYFILILNAPWPDRREPLPPILLGPSGIHLLYPTLLKGDYRIKDNRLWIYDTGKQRFRPYRPDPIPEILQVREQLTEFFNNLTATVVTIEARLVFLNPGTYVDSVDQEETTLSPLMVDGLPRYLEQLSRQRRYQRSQIQKWLTALAHASTDPMAAAIRKQRRPEATKRKRRPGGLTRTQWIILGVLAAIDLLIVVGFFILFFVLD